MPSQPYDDDAAECDADKLPTSQQRSELIRDTLRLAHLFGPGPEQNQLQQIARSLTFLVEDKATLSHRAVPWISGDWNRVVGIRLPRALLESIRRWAETEGLPLSEGIKIWLQLVAVKRGQIGCH